MKLYFYAKSRYYAIFKKFTKEMISILCDGYIFPILKISNSLIFRQDLAWWMNYCRSQPIDQLIQIFSKKTVPEEEVKEDLSAKQTKQSINISLEITAFQCILRVRDGPVISVGSHLVVFSSDHVSILLMIGSMRFAVFYICFEKRDF